MFRFLRKSSACLCMVSLGLFSSIGLGNIWEQVARRVEGVRTSYIEVTPHLSMHASPKSITQISHGHYVISGDNGFITVDPEAIRSYSGTTEHNRLEFEYKFFSPCHASSTISTAEESSEALPNRPVVGARVALDIIPHHKLFDSRQIGGMPYPTFVLALQAEVQKLLTDRGAIVSLLRPRLQMPSATVTDALNEEEPFNVVVSMQCNDDKQNCMEIFLPGNVQRTEFSSEISERQRARTVHSLITQKFSHSYKLAAYVLSRCLTSLGVQPLDWALGSFDFNKEGEANSIPVPALDASLRTLHGSALDLPIRDGHHLGFGSRNLFLHGLFSEAVIVTFPDFQWLDEKAKEMGVEEFIKRFSIAITEGVSDYLQDAKP